VTDDEVRVARARDGLRVWLRAGAPAKALQHGAPRPAEGEVWCVLGAAATAEAEGLVARARAAAALDESGWASLEARDPAGFLALRAALRRARREG
jgi:hypothetical protein